MPTQIRRWCTSGIITTQWVSTAAWRLGIWKMIFEKIWQLTNCSFSSQFDLISFKQGNVTLRRREGDFSALQVKFHLKRHTGYFLIQVNNYILTVLIIINVWHPDLHPCDFDSNFVVGLFLDSSRSYKW